MTFTYEDCLKLVRAAGFSEEEIAVMTPKRIIEVGVAIANDPVVLSRLPQKEEQDEFQN
jgi:hypothetical protein